MAAAKWLNALINQQFIPRFTDKFPHTFDESSILNLLFTVYPTASKQTSKKTIKKIV